MEDVMVLRNMRVYESLFLYIVSYQSPTKWPILNYVFEPDLALLFPRLYFKRSKGIPKRRSCNNAYPKMRVSFKQTYFSNNEYKTLAQASLSVSMSD